MGKTCASGSRYTSLIIRRGRAGPNKKKRKKLFKKNHKSKIGRKKLINFLSLNGLIPRIEFNLIEKINLYNSGSLNFMLDFI